MKAKKGMQALSLLLILTLVGTMFVPVVSAKVESLDDKLVLLSEGDLTGLETEIELIQIDPKLKEATEYSWMIAVSDEEKKILLNYIDNSSLSVDDKEKMKQFMKKIWNKYPITFTRKNTTTYRLLDKNLSKIELSAEENENLKIIATATGKYLNMKYSSKSVKWGGTPHGDMIEMACLDSQVSYSDAQTAKSAAPVPDVWPYCPPNLPDWYEWVVNTIMHSWYHYWDPNAVAPLDGGAPGECENWADSARNNQNYRFTYLGYSSHFLTDVGNPMHTGKAWEQYLDLGNSHSLYETYVSSNWAEYKEILDEDNNWYSVSDPAETTRSIARYTNGYLDTLWDKVYYYPDTFGSDGTVKAITRNCLLVTQRNTVGLVRYVTS